MSLPTSLLAYVDCAEVWNRACESAAGVRVPFDTREAAYNFRMRMHQARKYHRREAERTYPSEHPRWGKSPWDPYQVKLRAHGDKHVLLVEPITASFLTIEEIEAPVMIAHEEQKMLAAPVDDLAQVPDGDELEGPEPDGEPEPEPAPLTRRF